MFDLEAIRNRQIELIKSLDKISIDENDKKKYETLNYQIELSKRFFFEKEYLYCNPNDALEIANINKAFLTEQNLWNEKLQNCYTQIINTVSI